MRVFIDTSVKRGWHLGANAHMLPWDDSARALERLHKTARNLGLRREWFQDGRWPHYDLTRRRYAAALNMPQVLRTTTRGYIVFRRVLPTGTFVEPGTGLAMRLGEWYIVSDSGSSYIAKGFKTPRHAERWLDENGGPGIEDRTTWNPADPTEGFTDPRMANIVQGLDMLLFWAANDSFTLSQCNPRKV